VLCCAVLCCAVLCCAVLCCAVLCCAVRCAVLCGVLCCAVLCCAVLCCAVLCCAVLCCAVLCCAVLCCAVLVYCNWFPWPQCIPTPLAWFAHQLPPAVQSWSVAAAVWIELPATVLILAPFTVRPCSRHRHRICQPHHDAWCVVCGVTVDRASGCSAPGVPAADHPADGQLQLL
jgi:hypothetical protein